MFTAEWLPHCGGITIHRISFTIGLSGGDTPYMYPAICVRKSAMVMNFFNTFLGST